MTPRGTARLGAAAALSLLAAASHAASVPTWSRDVAPILHRHCVSCHRDHGSAPFALATYEDARDRARDLAAVTARGYMPPWLPAPGPPFAGERRLSRDEVATLGRWAAAGAPAGDAGKAPRPPAATTGWQLGEPDLVVEMPEAFVLAASGADVFRSFVLPVEGLAATRRWVRAVEILPGDPRIVHHATLLVDATDSSRRLDAADAPPGFDGMGTFSRARAPDGHLVGWTPGKVPHTGDPELSWELRQGAALVLELHLLPSGREETVRARVGLHFAAEPPSRRPLAIRLGHKTIDIAAGETAHRVEDRFRLPAAVEVLAIYPHAHFLCRSMTVDAALPDGRLETLLEIDRWDFAWQDQYHYREPIALPAGAELRMAYVYDNSEANPRNPHHPPRRVVYGPSSGDEMGDLWLQVVPRDAGDFDALARALDRRESAADIAGFRAALARAPDDATLHFNLGSELVLAGGVDEGIAELERAVALDPDFEAAYNNLGNALIARGDLDRAVVQFERAAAVAGGASPDTLFNLANTLAALGRFDQAHRHYDRVLELAPRFREARLNKAAALARQGRPDDAVAELERCLAADPAYIPALFNLALLRRGDQGVDGVFEHLARALAADPGSAQLRMLRGDLLLDNDRFDEAAAAYRSVIEVEPRSADAWANLGRALARVGRRVDAEKALREALAIERSHAVAREVLIELGLTP